jgi:uncharacterized repeat protein (TIGR03803 family)
VIRIFRLSRSGKPSTLAIRVKNLVPLILAASLGLTASLGQAVILNDAAGRRTSAPTDPALLDLWNLQGNLAGVSFTPIGPRSLLTAGHGNNGNQTSVTLSGTTYAINNSPVWIPGTDLQVWTLRSDTPSFPRWADLWNPAADGVENHRPLVVFGRGTTRGASVLQSPSGGPLRGWLWGAYDGARSWGQDSISGKLTLTDAPYAGAEILHFDFDAPATSSSPPSTATTPTASASLSAGDSGGGLFVQNTAGQWKLAGLNFYVDAWSYTAASPILGTSVQPGWSSSLFNASGLWNRGDSPATFVDPATSGDPVPSRSYASRVAQHLTALDPYVPLPGDANTDGQVNFADLLILAQHYNQSTDLWSQADFTRDGQITFADLLVLAQNYNRTRPVPGLTTSTLLAEPQAAPIIPEPSSLLLLSATTTLLKRRRRKWSVGCGPRTNARPPSMTTQRPPSAWPSWGAVCNRARPSFLVRQAAPYGTPLHRIPRVETAFAFRATSLTILHRSHVERPEKQNMSQQTHKRFIAAKRDLTCSALALACGVSGAAAATLTTLAHFNGSANGSFPTSSLIADASGNLYGTTGSGGSSNLGTVFKIPGGTTNSPGTLTTLATFTGLANGSRPISGLIADATGNLYGTTSYGGANNDGTVFKIPGGATATPGALTTLVTFSGNGTGTGNGITPSAGLTADASGNLYGTTYGGGAGFYGTVFKIPGGATSTPGSVVTLAAFSDFNNLGPVGGPKGSYPRGALTIDHAGNLYSTTKHGGAGNFGTVFKIPGGATTAPGPITTLAVFNGSGNGRDPSAGLVADSAGNLYGTTLAGGAFIDFGTVFKIPAGATDNPGPLTTLVRFNGGGNGSYPESGLLIDAAGNLFGTTKEGGTSDHGTVFKIPGGATENPGTLITLATFTGAANGSAPRADLLADAQGNLYGTTTLGGTNNMGTVFKIADAGFVVPEPGSLLIVALLPLALRRRRGSAPRGMDFQSMNPATIHRNVRVRSGKRA